jgi:hypothetical protein
MGVIVRGGIICAPKKTGRVATVPERTTLRDLAHQYIHAAEQESAMEIKRRLAGRACALAQLAAKIERGRQMVAFVTAANIQRYNRMLMLDLD